MGDKTCSVRFFGLGYDSTDSWIRPGGGGRSGQTRTSNEAESMQVVLVMFRGEGERRSFSLPRDVTVMGRREDCDLRIPLGEVSRKHCRLIADGEAPSSS